MAASSRFSSLEWLETRVNTQKMRKEEDEKADILTNETMNLLTKNETSSTDNVTSSSNDVTSSTDNVTSSTDAVTSSTDDVTSSTDVSRKG